MRLLLRNGNLSSYTPYPCPRVFGIIKHLGGAVALTSRSTLMTRLERGSSLT